MAENTGLFWDFEDSSPASTQPQPERPLGDKKITQKGSLNDPAGNAKKTFYCLPVSLSSTTSRAVWPRESASCFPSGDHPKSKILSRLKSVIFLGDDPLSGCTHRLATPCSSSPAKAMACPSGV